VSGWPCAPIQIIQIEPSFIAPNVEDRMEEFFETIHYFLTVNALNPHGICLGLRPELLYTHMASDALIGLAYFSIPLALGVFLWRRRDVNFGWMIWCFVAFIMACGLTHLMHIWTVWRPDYGVEALIKAFTAVVSVVTAVALWPLLPRLIAIPSPAKLQAAVAERDAAIISLERETQERIRAERQLAQAQRNELMGQLIGGVAHDFNNLLMIVSANVARAKRRTDDKDITQPLDHAVEAADRASRLTRQLMVFSGRHIARTERGDLNEMVRASIALMEAVTGENIVVRTELSPQPLVVELDLAEAQSAFMNLLLNARDAMPNGGDITVTTAAVEACEFAILRVRDTGIGIPPANKERIFEPFFITKDVDHGTGLGLSQVLGFARQSGGRVDVDSDGSDGATFTIWLPLAGANEAQNE